MKGINFNISSLFGGAGAGSDSFFGSFNFSDFASIKNGSYRKLVKSYYAEQKSDAAVTKKNADKKNTDKAKTDFSIDTTGFSKMRKEADGLKAAADALGKEDLWKSDNGEYDMDKIISAVKDFASEYNNVISQSAKVNSKELSQSMRYMNSMTGTMSKILSKAGINVGVDGKMSVDEDALKKASVKDIKSLFTGASSYGTQIANRASEISRESVMNSSVYSSNGMLSGSIDSMFSKWI